LKLFRENIISNYFETFGNVTYLVVLVVPVVTRSFQNYLNFENHKILSVSSMHENN